MGTILHLDWCWDLTRCDFSLTSGMRNYCFLKCSKVEHVNPFKCRTIDAMSLALEVDHSSPGLMLDPTWCDFSLTSGMRNYCFLKHSEVEPVNPLSAGPLMQWALLWQCQKLYIQTTIDMHISTSSATQTMLQWWRLFCCRACIFLSTIYFEAEVSM